MKRPFRAEKPLMWLINLALTAAFALVLLIIAEQITRPGWAWYSRSLRCWPLVFCFVGGLAARRMKKLPFALLPVSLVLSGAAMCAVFPSLGGGDIAYIALALVLGAGVFFLGLRGDEPFPPKLAVFTICLYLFADIWFFVDVADVSVTRPLTWLSLGAFLLSLYSFNAASLVSGLHNARGGSGEMRVPAALRGKNLAMLTLFLAAALLIATARPLHYALDALLAALLGVVKKLIFAIPAQDMSMPVAAPSPEPTPERAVLEMENTLSPAFTAVYVVIMVIVGIIAVLAVVLPIVGLRSKGGGRARRLLRRLMSRRRVEDYEDSVERVAGLREVLKKRRERAAAAIKRLRQRRERYEDMPDDRARVRFVFRELMQSRRFASAARSMTPREMAERAGRPEMTELAELYNSARYNERAAVRPEAAIRAREAWQKLKRS